MKKSLKTNLIFLSLAVIVGIFIYSCSEDTVTPPPPTVPEIGSMSGTITFVDTNRHYTGGYYDVSVYATWPPSGPPSGSDTIEITKNGNVYQGTFKIRGLTSGANYVTASAWIRTPYGPGSVSLLGVRGCDTNHSMSCWFSNPKRDTLPTNQGLDNINFLSWIDTTNRIYHF